MSVLLRSVRCILLYTLCLSAVVTTAGKAAADEQILSEIEVLENRFQEFSNEYYSELSQLSDATPLVDSDVLTQRFNELNRQGEAEKAVTLLVHNKQLIIDYIDDRATIDYIAFLLQQNEYYTARLLFNEAKTIGSRIIINNSAYHMARYYQARRQWQKVLDTLTGVIEHLALEEAEHSLLIKGIALQNLKQHRPAISAYEQIPQTSKYYLIATLNKAVAHIRQDWWSDAHDIITTLTSDPEKLVPNEMRNRLFTVLGYSLLRKQYYRDARNIFRNIDLDSRYVNRGLLGIALTAASQDDYVGALNAIEILKKKNSPDLPGEESHLLVPYIYGKLEQYLTATAGYSDAIAHYNQRTETLKTLLEQSDSLIQQIHFSENKSTLTIGQARFNYSDSYPVPFVDNLNRLAVMTNYAVGGKLEHKQQELLLMHRTLMESIGRHYLQQRLTHINSYIDQSRYGLARVFDSSLLE